MKYNKNETLNHIVSQKYPCCIKDYNDIILSEDDLLVSKPSYFKDVEAIDLDCVEIETAKLERRPIVHSTMDSAFAISDVNNLEMLLVEFRFNYSNLSNLLRKKLLDKVSGSIVILGTSIKINDTYIFIFKPNLVQQARSRFRRMNPQLPNNFIAMDLIDLKTQYF